MNRSTRAFHVLMVDDNPGDVLLFRECFAESGHGVTLFDVPAAAEGLAFLKRQGPYAEGPRIDLLLLDVNLPGMSGLDLLRQLRDDQRIGRLPVLMLSGSTSPAEIGACYDAGASAFLVKPAELEHLRALTQSICHFWLDATRLPPERPRSPDRAIHAAPCLLAVTRSSVRL